MILLLLRRLSFWLSLAGLFSAYLLIQQLRAEKPIPPPEQSPVKSAPFHLHDNCNTTQTDLGLDAA